MSDDLERRLDQFERTQREHAGLIAGLRKDHEAMKAAVNELTSINREQTRTLRCQDEKLGEIHDALLGTLDAENKPGIVTTVHRLGRWQANCSRAFWIIVTVAVGGAMLGLWKLIAHAIRQGVIQ